MGNCTEVESFNMATQSEEASITKRAIIDMVERQPAAYKEGFVLSKTGRLYVTMQGVLSYIREFMEIRITERALQINLKSMIKSSTPYTKESVVFYEVDIDALIGFAEPWGLKCGRLREARKRAEGQLE